MVEPGKTTAPERSGGQSDSLLWIVCRLPTKSPWLNPIEPKWVHSKRAVADPTRWLPVSELIERICAYYDCELTQPITQSDC